MFDGMSGTRGDAAIPVLLSSAVAALVDSSEPLRAGALFETGFCPSRRSQMTPYDCENFAYRARMQFWRFVDIEMTNVMIGIQVDIVK